MNASASGANNGGSWANGYTDLQSTLGASICTEVWVKSGTYKPTTGTSRSATFQLKSGVALYGGFAGTETSRDQRDPAANVTILSGDLNGNDVGFTNNAENAYHVVTGATGATLDGFTITAGNANSGNHQSGADSQNIDSGGGMYNRLSSPTLTNIIFSGNKAYAWGGGMVNFGSSPIMTNVAFSANSAGYGGGMFNTSSSPMLTNVTFSNNSASYAGCSSVGSMCGDGGGMENRSNSSPTLTNVTFSGNSASCFSGTCYNGYGGGMHNNSSDPTLTNVTFSGNSADTGGGMYNYSSSPQVRNAIFWNNTATTGAQIYDVGNPNVRDSIVQDGYTGGTNIITSDPLLGTLGNYGGFTQTIPLLVGSSAIDMGSDAACPATDQRGITRPQGAHCDIGAYEYGNAITPTPTVTNTAPSTPTYTPTLIMTSPTITVTATPTLAPTGLRSIYLPLVLRNYPPPGGAFTPTPSPTPTGSPARTMTFAPTLFPTATVTPSSTATLAPAFTPTLTLTPTQTSTSTHTPAPIIPIDGQWVGRTNQDIPLGFTVQNNGTQWYFFLVACPGGGYAAGGPGPITNASMSYNDGLIAFNGEFTSATYVTGSYDTANCGPGTWWAIPSSTATPIATLSITPTPTGTLPPSTITPTATSLPAAGILNGDFESGPGVGWTEYSLQVWPVIVSGSGFHAGSYGAWLGGGDDEIGYIEQQVTIPSGAPYLVYWQWISSEDSCGYDFGRVLINASEVDAYDLCIDTSTGDWVTHSVDLSAYAGQSVTLQIGIETDSSGVSSLYVDDVSFQASAPAPGQIKGIGANTNAFTTQRKIGITTPRKKPYGITPPGLQNSLTHAMHQQTMIPR